MAVCFVHVGWVELLWVSGKVADVFWVERAGLVGQFCLWANVGTHDCQRYYIIVIGLGLVSDWEVFGCQPLNIPQQVGSVCDTSNPDL